MVGLHYFIAGLTAVCFLLTFVSCYRAASKKNLAAAEEILLHNMQASKGRYFNYGRLELFLKEYGVAYMLYESINPVMYIIIKIITGILLAVLVMFQMPEAVLCGAAFLFGFFFLDILVRLNNDSDNKAMMSDIANTYDILKIQMRAGVFITDAIFFCYQNCSNRRLKDGFLGLYLDIKSNQDVPGALRNFNSRFKNSHISTLCAVLEQSLVTGQSADILDNLTKKNVDIQKLLNAQYRRKIQGIYHKLGMFIIIGMLAVILYMAGINLTDAISNF